MGWVGHTIDSRIIHHLKSLLLVVDINLDNPDFDKFPNFRKIKGYECTLKPGDVLYVPMYW